MVDADLLVDGEVQREVEEGIHLAVFGLPFPFPGACGIAQQGVVFGVAGGDVGSGHFGADQGPAGEMLRQASQKSRGPDRGRD